jgi:hypothetical protein
MVKPENQAVMSKKRQNIGGKSGKSYDLFQAYRLGGNKVMGALLNVCCIIK